MQNLSKKMTSLLAATTIACAGAGIGVQTAFAETAQDATSIESTLSETTIEAADQIDPSQTVTLHILKYDGEIETGATGAPEQATPLAGVTFKVEKVKNTDGTSFDLTTIEGWRKFNQLVSAADANQQIADLAKDGDVEATETTQDDGSANFSFDNGVGVYRVTETDTPDGYSTTAPFLIALPGTATADDGSETWTYERTVYPKNQQITPTKEVDDNAAGLGKNLSYRLSSRIPSSNLATFEVTDDLVEQLNYVEDSLKVKMDSQGGSQETLLATSEDYTTELPEAAANGGTVKVILTEKGFAKLEEFYQQHNDAKIHVDFQARVVALPPNGQIDNTADFNINGSHYSTNIPDQDPNQPSTPASTTFGNLVISKISDPEVADEDLKNAQFQAYLCKKEGDKPWVLLGDPLKFSTVEQQPDAEQLKDTFTTGEDAKARAFGLPVKSTSTGSGEAENNYCLVETKAPEGFVRNPEIIPVEKNVQDGQLVELTASVENQKKTFLNQLPATGAWGIILVFLVGLALLARGLYTTRRDNQVTA